MTVDRLNLECIGATLGTWTDIAHVAIDALRLAMRAGANRDEIEALTDRLEIATNAVARATESAP